MKEIRGPFLLLVAVVFLHGCYLTAKPDPVAKVTVAHSGNATRLVEHPQFGAAARAAPDFVLEALNTISKLEHDLKVRP